jgi:hypothetical protein
MTPSGRFEANREICLSISGHHEETWQPAWGVRTALVAYVFLPVLEGIALADISCCVGSEVLWRLMLVAN